MMPMPQPCSVAQCPWAAEVGVLPWSRTEGRWAPWLVLCSGHLQVWHDIRIRGGDIQITVRELGWEDPYMAAVKQMARSN